VTDLDFTLRRGERLQAPRPAALADRGAVDAGDAGTRRPTLSHRCQGDPRGIEIDVQLPVGVLAVAVPSKAAFSPTTYIFVMWMVGSSLVLLAVATIFLRNR